ncbi:MAG: biotin/lipoyl-binding protein, partial [Anaerolineae bacterium]
MKRSAWFSCSVLFVALLVAGCVPKGGTGQATAVPEPVEAEEAVNAEGRVVPVRWASLGVPVSGRVAEVLVAEGDVVQAGEVLVRLD